MKKSKIEFIDGEKYCRYNGIPLSPENCRKLYGYEGEVDIVSGDTIIIGDTIYTDMKFCDLVKELGEVNGEVKDYDEVLSQGGGFHSWRKDKELENTVVIRLEWLEGLDNVKPFKELKVDYPDFNISKYIEVYDELESYYDEM